MSAVKDKNSWRRIKGNRKVDCLLLETWKVDEVNKCSSIFMLHLCCFRSTASPTASPSFSVSATLQFWLVFVSEFCPPPFSSPLSDSIRRLIDGLWIEKKRKVSNVTAAHTHSIEWYVSVMIAHNSSYRQPFTNSSIVKCINRLGGGKGANGVSIKRRHSCSCSLGARLGWLQMH